VKLLEDPLGVQKVNVRCLGALDLGLCREPEETVSQVVTGHGVSR
jgi:hypothetical protein